MSSVRTFDNFTVIEGPDAVGKATQAETLSQIHGVPLTAFPRYATEHGKIIKELLHDRLQIRSDGKMPTTSEADAKARLFQGMMTWDRYLWAPTFHVGHKIQKGWVCDRYWMSGFVYGGLDGIDDETLIGVHMALPQPDLAILLNVPPELQAERQIARGRQPDMYEGAGGNFMARVHNRYMALWEHVGPMYFPDTMWAIVDGTGTPEEVHRRIMEIAGAGVGSRG